MDRRQYLSGVGAGVAALPFVSGAASATAHISVDIAEITAPLEGGDLLDVTAELENSGPSDERVDLDFVVGEDEEVVRQRTVPVQAGETRAVEFLQFRTYPARQDSAFPIRLEAGSGVAETTVEVAGVDAFDAQYAHPDRDRELTVHPETTVLFEIDDDVVGHQGDTHWYVDGEYTMTTMGPWPSTYFHDVGRAYYAHTFESAGSYTVDAAVVSDRGNAASRWEVTASADGAGPPAVESSRPTTGELGADEFTTLELDLSSPDTELDRVVWWQTQADVILDVSEVDGTSDTASIDVDGGCHTCRIEAWVIDDDNAYTSVTPWMFEDFDSGDDDDGDDTGEVSVMIQETNSPVTGGETLEVTATVENIGADHAMREIDLVVGEDPEVVATRTVGVSACETETVTLEFETYPVAQDDEFPVRVETDGNAAERIVTVFGTET